MEPIGKYNPFKPGSVASPETFGGRFEVLCAIERLLDQAKQGNPRHFLVDGKRGIGKTSLLHYVSRMASGSMPAPSGATFRFRTLAVNLAADDSPFDCVDKIRLQIDAIADEQQLVMSYVRKAWDVLKSLETPLWRLRPVAIPLHELRRRLGVAASEVDRSLAARFDGLGIFIDDADRPDDEADVGALLRGLSEHVARLGSSRVFFAVAGGQGKRGVAAKLAASDSSALRTFRRFTLEGLSEADQLDALGRGFRHARSASGGEMVLEDSGAEWIVAFAHGDPSRLQELAYGAVELDRDGRIDTRDVLAALFATPGQEAHPRDLEVGESKSAAAYAFGAILVAVRKAGKGGMTRDEIGEATRLEGDLLAGTIESLEAYELVTSAGTPGKYRPAPALSDPAPG